MEEQTLLKVEYIDSPCSTQEELSDFKSAHETEVIEFSVIGIKDKELSQRKSVIQSNIERIDGELSVLEEKIEELNSEIDSLTSHADKFDITISVISGIIAGVVDSLWVGEFSLDRANDWGNSKTNNFVVKIAKSQGYSGDDLPGAVAYLEKKYPIPADKSTNDFGGGKQHHLRDFSHHASISGLCFSLLTQFTCCVYGTDTFGKFCVLPINEKAQILIGKNTSEKLLFGVVHWFFHMVSDIAGASSSVRTGSFGTGLPGPLVSFLKEFSSLPIFSRVDKNGNKEFSVFVSKLFNGTLLGKRDSNGKIIEAVKFDLRTEIGIAHELGRQAIPVLLNECVVRSFYFIRRLYCELRDNHIHNFEDLYNLNWKKVLPFNNRTIVRMMTISSATFTACDVVDAIARTGGITPECILRINFVGVGRLAIAIGTDSVMGIKRAGLVRKHNETEGQIICLSNMKLYYKNADVACAIAELHSSEARMHHAEADLWIAVRDTENAFEEMRQQITKVVAYCNWSMDQEDSAWNEIGRLAPDLKKTELFDYIMQL